MHNWAHIILAYSPQASSQQSSSVHGKTATGGVAFTEFPHAAGADKFLGASHPAGSAMWLALFYLLRRKNLGPIFYLHRERVASHLVCP
jgi:hypothetical protein